MSETSENQELPGFWASLFRWLLSSLVTALWLTPALVLSLPAPRITKRLLKSWSGIQLKIFGIRVTVTDRNHGRYDSPPYLFVILNQTSLSEVFIVHHAIPADFNAFMNVEFALLPFVGWLLWLMGSVVIVRQWPRQGRLAMEKAGRLLKRGKNFYMSIEGQRSRDGSLGPYRKGAAILAINAQATIVPIMIRGAREILPFGEWRMRPGTVETILCETISTKGLTYENRDELVKKLRAI